MEATYCIGSDTDFSRMFDQYLYKRESSDLSLSMPTNHNGVYPVNEQTFHTPSFGDEDFDITHLGPPQTTSSNNSQHPPSYQHTQVLSNHVKNEPMSPRPQQMCNTNGYHYMSPPLPPSSDHNSHNMGINVSANYTNSHQQPAFNSIANNQSSQLLLLQSHHQQTSQQSQPQMHQPTQQPSHYNVAAMRSYAQSPQANSPNGMASTPGPNPPGAHETTTTSDDSDDSTPHTTLVTGMKRPSPEPIENDVKIQKKPKPTKKKKKRDPNEPQKPVSAYALFFRDTQAAIKGNHPNTSFGEVSKIVASMWDGLDAESKNVYKKKTETAKKDYLKALAAYRATLVSKGAGENDNAGYAGGYGGYGGGYSGYSPPAGLPSPPIQSPSSHQQLQHGNINNMNTINSMNSMNSMNNMNKKSQMIMTDTRLTMNGHQSNMMNPPSHMTQTNHIDHSSSQQQQQQQQSQQPPQVNAVSQQQTQSLNPNYPHQPWSWCYRLGPSNQ